MREKRNGRNRDSQEERGMKKDREREEEKEKD